MEDTIVMAINPDSYLLFSFIGDTKGDVECCNASKFAAQYHIAIDQPVDLFDIIDQSCFAFEGQGNIRYIRALPGVTAMVNINSRYFSSFVNVKRMAYVLGWCGFGICPIQM